jgi:hypothetical protein
MAIHPAQFHPLLYAILVVSIIVVLAYVLVKFGGISNLYGLTFILIGTTYMLASIWDINAIGNGIDFTISVWIIFMGVVGSSYIFLYIYYRHGSDFYQDRTALIKVFLYTGYIIGLMMVFGVLEDFGCYILWGMEYFNPDFAIWIPHWTWGIPTFYFMAIPGIIIILITLYYSKKYRVKDSKRRFRQLYGKKKRK